MKTALTIAGSDCSGGAGIQADLKTMTMNGVYAMSVITALTAQNTTGVRAIQESTPDFLKQQLDSVFEDIYPDAVKIGMAASGELICVIADRLKYYGAKNIVVDPVMVATSGAALMKKDALQALIAELLPGSTLVTPNIPEAQVLSGLTIETKEDMMTAAKQIGDSHQCAVLLKGGHSINDANDLLYADGELVWFEASVSITPIPMVQDVRFPAPSHPILPRDLLWPNLCKERKTISPALWQRCWIWEKAPVR